MKIIFLDIDGVLNGYNKFTYSLIDLSKLLHIPEKYMRNILNIFAVKEKYVRRLAYIVRKTNAKVVMSSSWRHAYWNNSYEDMNVRCKRLYDFLQKYHVDVIGITPRSRLGIREEEIKEWLNTTYLYIESFVVLDDESFDLQSFVGKELIKTSKVKEGNMICGSGYEDTGLKWKHAKMAVKILNRK